MQQNNPKPPNGKPFIPTWLDDLGLTQPEFRLYCHLCRRADLNTGIAWPQASTIATACKMSMNTVWATLKSLEKHKLISRAGKPFGGSNRYKIHTLAISANGIPIEHPISANETPIDTVSNQRKSDTPISANGIHQSAQMDSREGSPSKVLQERFSNNNAQTIYDAYPRKVAKKEALKAISKAIKAHGFEYLLERTRLYATIWQDKDKQFIPHPSKFFNQERFNDDPQESATSSSNRPTGRSIDTSRRPGSITPVQGHE